MMKERTTCRVEDLLKIRAADIFALGAILAVLTAGAALLLWLIYG